LSLLIAHSPPIPEALTPPSAVVGLAEWDDELGNGGAASMVAVPFSPKRWPAAAGTHKFPPYKPQREGEIFVEHSASSFAKFLHAVTRRIGGNGMRHLTSKVSNYRWY
jgi:hypothetical protein